jgi:hypothetical protein
MNAVKRRESLLQESKRSEALSPTTDLKSAYKAYKLERHKSKHKAKVHAVHTPKPAVKKQPHVPKFPRNDSVVAKVTPESKGAQPCWHCGSPKHWDNMCPEHSNGAKQARVHFASITGDNLAEQEAYEDLEEQYFELASSESSSDSDSSDESSGSESNFQ